MITKVDGKVVINHNPREQRFVNRKQFPPATITNKLIYDLLMDIWEEIQEMKRGG